MLLKITRRIDALKAGEPRYYTGNPCLRGHLSVRSTSTGGCIECVKEFRAGKYKEKRKTYIQEYNKRQRAEFAALRKARAEISAGS